MNEKFILTQSPEIAIALIDQGVNSVSCTEDAWCFLNSGKINFAELDKSKYTFTNILPM